MLAYLGLASRPAKVENISADRVTLLTNFLYPSGSRMAVELVNDARTFKCILRLRVDDVQPHPDGGYTLDAIFCRSLTDDELRDLS
jgi:hypothetical protein